MKYSKIFRTLALAIILSLLMLAIPATPVLAVVESVSVNPTRGEVGTDVSVLGHFFEAGERVYIYFSSYKADVGDDIEDLDAYEEVRRVYTVSDPDPYYEGVIDTYFDVPDKLTEGNYPEEVHGGDHYVYVTYTREGRIETVDNFTVIGIELSPETGNVGDEVEIVGKGFKSGKDISYIKYDEIEVDIVSGDDATDGDGEFICTIIIPESTAGAQTIAVKVKYDSEVEAEFTVEPAITISPVSGSTGDEVTVNGTGFGRSKYLTIYFNDVVMTLTSGTARADTYGSFEELKFNVPVVAAATHNVKAKDESDNVATATFAVSAIELDPDEGNVGDEIEISGAGFRGNSYITVRYAGSVVDIASGDEQTDSAGEFTCTIIIPKSTADDHTITVADGTTGAFRKAEAEFTVEPEITISPTSGSIGEGVTVSGTGFGYREDITIYFNDVIMTLISGTARADTYGSFKNLKFNVPAVAPGTCTVEAEDDTGNTATAQFNIASYISLGPTTSLNSPGHVGMELTISGSGFIANHQVRITYLSELTTVATTTTGADGAFSVTFSAPASSGGVHTITATDGLNTLSETFYMESTPPSMVYPLLPKMGGNLKVGKFDWCGDAANPAKEVTDASLPITYTLEIAKDSAFTNIVISKEGLTVSEYTLTEEERELLPSTKRDAPYYWRVKATDSAFNETGWTGTGTFYVAELSLTPATSLASPGYVGTELTVSGTGFIANQRVTVTYLSEPIAVATTTTDANGSFLATFNAPASTGGAHTITVTDGLNTFSKTFYMESAPPSTVYPLLPEMGGNLKEGKFDWCGDAANPAKEVTDDSIPITYTLEIAKDSNFTNIVIKKEGLTVSEYTLTEEETELLPSTEKDAFYYWRVKAIDSAFNETGWSGTGTFSVGFTFEMSGWVMYTIFGVVALLLGILGFWIGRRTSYSAF